MMSEKNDNQKLVWLSHILTEKTPAYGGGDGLVIENDKQICCGDSCNTAKLSFSNHLGTHVDAPRHFVEIGKSTESYEPNDWIFNKPYVIHLNVNPSEIITEKHIESACDKIDDADLILIKTGYEKHRGNSAYWETSPGYAPELADFLIHRFKSFTAIGMDTISISSYQHRELGREVHNAFLSKGIRIFEDLSLAPLKKGSELSKIIALPLRFEHSDGAPCSVVGLMNDL